eukprot:3631617-Rhodomonas_salina.1
MMLRGRYAMCGTDVGYAAIRRDCEVVDRLEAAVSYRPTLLLCDVRAYAATRRIATRYCSPVPRQLQSGIGLRAHYAMSGNELAYRGRCAIAYRA